MKSRMFAFAIALAGALVGCANPDMPATSTLGASASGTPTRLQSRMCQVFRSYEDRAVGGELQEACTRQLGPQMCARCLDSGF